MNGLDIAESIAERLEQRMPATPAGASFASGSAGNALFFLALAQARSSERWSRAAHESLKLAATTGQATGSGLFAGLSGLLFVTAYAARVDPRYAKLRDQCAKALAASAAVSPALQRAQRFSDYDLVSGVAGLHAALLYADKADEARETRSYLEWLVADSDRWSCPHELKIEHGRANDLGLAHGIAGVLSVLAADDEVSTDTLVRLAELLWDMRLPGTLQWPASIGPFDAKPTRAAWCYGNPGVAMALVRVALRLGSQAIAERARAALLATVDAPLESWGQVDYALCHGAAGNGLILEIGAQALGDIRIGACAARVIEGLLGAYDAATPLGYRTWDNLGNCWIDDPGLMTGACGIGLAVVTLSGEVDGSWMASYALPDTLKKATGTTC